MKTQPLTADEDRVRCVLRKLLANRDIKAADLARATGYSPSTISTKLKGHAVISMADARTFADALDVDPAVFFMEPDDAVRWLLDHPDRRQAGYARVALTAAVVGAAVLARVPPEVAAGVVSALSPRIDVEPDVMSGEVESTLPLAA